MRKIVGIVSMVGIVGALLWGSQAQAACTNLADSSDPACKNALACQNEIGKQAAALVAAVQKAHLNALTKSISGKQTKKPAFTCVGGPKAGKPCSANNGTCKSNSLKGKFCNADGDCDGTMGSCDRNKGCNVASANDTYECQVDGKLSDFAKDIDKAQAKAHDAIIKKCNTAPTIVPISDIGMDNNPLCPGAATAPTNALAYEALIECMTQSGDGDFLTGKIVDWNHRVFEKIYGSSVLAPPQQKPGKESTSPYMLLELQGSQVLQIGTAAGGDNSSAGGGLIPLSMASCTSTYGGTGTGNGNVGCTTDADCGKLLDGVTNGNCKLNGLTTCPSLSPSCRRITAPGPVKANGIDGNTLAVSEACSGGIATCLITTTKNSGNGTAADGGADVATGEVFTYSPIKTNVWITGVAVDCDSFQSCPHCSGGVCDGGANIGMPCSGISTTVECPPGGAPAATVPNPLQLSTEPKSMTANGSVQFCGFCDTSAAAGCQGGASICSNGCTFSYPGGANQECLDKGFGSVCDFGSTAAGFHGDPTAASITNDGIRSHYTPVTTGLFCVGVTGNPTIDGAAGLPGPARVVLPQTNIWVHTTN